MLFMGSGHARGFAGLYYLFGKQAPGLPLGILGHRGNDRPPLTGDLGLLQAHRACLPKRFEHDSSISSHKMGAANTGK